VIYEEPSAQSLVEANLEFRHPRCIRDVSVRGAPGCVVLCCSVPDRAPITPARSLHSDTNRDRTIRANTVDFPFWEQEAGSSNLPTPTTTDRSCLRPCVTDVSDCRALQAEFRSPASRIVALSAAPIAGMCRFPACPHRHCRALSSIASPCGVPTCHVPSVVLSRRPIEPHSVSV
jgi:hypothetical protein